MEPNSLLAQFNSGRAATQALPSQVEASSLQMDPRTQTAYLMNNALQPRQMRGQNVGVNRFREAEDIRRNTENNRLDLRANMNNQAVAEQNRLNRDFQAQEGQANRETTERNTKAQLENARVLQGALIKSRKELQDDQQEFTLNIEDRRLANSLQLAGVNAENAKELAMIKGGFQMAATTAELGQRADEFKQRIGIMRDELKQKKEEAEKDRTAMLQGKAIDQAGATGRTAMQIELAEKELDWQEKMFNAEQKLAQDKFNQEKTDKENFSKSAGEVLREYNTWTTTGIKDMRKDLTDNFVKTHGLAHAARINGNGSATFEVSDGAGGTTRVEPFTGKSGKLNPVWTRELLTRLDAFGSADFAAKVDDVVRQRDIEFGSLMNKYLGAAAATGTPINLPQNSLQPRVQQPQQQPVGPQPLSPAQQSRLNQLRQKQGGNP